MKLEFSRVPKNIQISNFVKIRTVGAELFHVYGQTGIQTRQSQQPLFGISRTRLKSGKEV